MLMIFSHASREALPVEESLNWRSFERLRFLDEGRHNFIGWRHTDLRGNGERKGLRSFIELGRVGELDKAHPAIHFVQPLSEAFTLKVLAKTKLGSEPLFDGVIGHGSNYRAVFRPEALFAAGRHANLCIRSAMLPRRERDRLWQ